MADKPSAFLIMPFDEEFDAVYSGLSSQYWKARDLASTVLTTLRVSRTSLGTSSKKSIRAT